MCPYVYKTDVWCKSVCNEPLPYCTQDYRAAQKTNACISRATAKKSSATRKNETNEKMSNEKKCIDT